MSWNSEAKKKGLKWDLVVILRSQWSRCWGRRKVNNDRARWFGWSVERKEAGSVREGDLQLKGKLYAEAIKEELEDTFGRSLKRHWNFTLQSVS